MVSVATMVAPERFTSTVNSKPIGPCPRITTTSSALRIQLNHALHAGIHGLDETGAIKRHAIGNFLDAALDDPIHHADILRKASARRLVSGRNADFLIDRALRIQLVPAVKTFPARDVMEDDDAIAGGESPHAAADGRHYARRLMSKDARRREQVVFDLLEIGVADPAALHADQQFARSDGRRRHLLHRHHAVAGIDRGAHCNGRRN